jgi:hypothetical protein
LEWPEHIIVATPSSGAPSDRRASAFVASNQLGRQMKVEPGLGHLAPFGSVQPFSVEPCKFIDLVRGEAALDRV